MCRSRGESASEWIFSSFRKGSRKWGGAQNWTLAKSFLFCVLSLALAKPWDCLKIILNPFQFTSVFSHYFLLPLHIHNADIWPSSSHARSLHLPARLFPRRVFLLMCTSSLSWHSKVLSTITISYLVSLLYIFFFSKSCLYFFPPYPLGCACILGFHHGVFIYCLLIQIQSFLEVFHHYLTLPHEELYSTSYSLTT